MQVPGIEIVYQNVKITAKRMFMSHDDVRISYKVQIKHSILLTNVMSLKNGAYFGCFDTVIVGTAGSALTSSCKNPFFKECIL